MIGVLRQIWTDPVWSKVIASAIVAGTAALCAYRWWEEVVAAIVIAATFLTAATPVSNWLLAILILCAVAVIGMVLFLMWAKLRSVTTDTVSWRDYREDNFIEMKWRWRYADDDTILGPVPFCPHCDLQIVPRDISDFMQVNQFLFRCDGCAINLATIDRPLAEIQHTVIRQIEKKLRSREWQKPA